MVNVLFVLSLSAADAASSQPASLPRSWSFGVGIAAPVIFVGYGLAMGPQLPHGQVTLERRLRGRTWLMLQANGTYGKGAGQPALFQYYPPPTQVTGVQLAETEYGNIGLVLGLRHAFSVAGLFDVSPYLTIGGEYSGATRTYRNLAFEQESSESFRDFTHAPGATAQVGLIIEREIISGLAIRLSTSILQARYTAAFSSYSRDTWFSAGLAFNPSLELRAVF